MIRRILPTDSSRGNRETPSAFTRGPDERPFYVVIDQPSVSVASSIPMLAGFASNLHVCILAVDPSMVSLTADGAIIEVEKLQRRESVRMVRHNLDVLASSGVSATWLAEPGMPERLAVAMWCQSKTCDAFVSESAEVLAVAREHYPLSNPMTPDEAIAAVGLVLRLRDDFTYREVQGSRCDTTGAGFYDLLCRGLLPGMLTWKSKCPFENDPLEVSAGGLANAVHRRMARAIRARDKALGCVFRPPTDTNTDEALFYLDSYLVSIAGAFDALARLAGLAYKLPSSVRRSWRESKFRERLGTETSGFLPLFQQGSRLRDVVDIVFLLRNTVHEQPLIPIAVLSEDARVMHYEVAFPAADKQELLEACTRAGGSEVWGIDVGTSNGISFDLHRFVERSLEASLEQIAKMMQLIDVSRFGVTSTVAESPEAEAALKLILPLAGICTSV